MLGGSCADLLVTATLLFLTQTGTQCRAENDISAIKLPDWRRDSEYVTQCSFGKQGNTVCDWTKSHHRSNDLTVDLIESGALAQGEACLEFWYLVPPDALQLRALLKSSAGLVEIWTSPALARDSWRQVFVPLNIIESGSKVVLEVVRTGSLENPVTFNSIGVRRGSCVCPINCDFEKNLCGWQQLIQDTFDWTRYSGATPTNASGPNHDHTTGAGFYLYIEGDSVAQGDPARLLSAECQYSGPVCLNFWYHMYGSATAMALNMYLLQGNKATKIWSMINNHGQEWHLGKVDVNVSSPFQIIMEGIRGSNVLSDVAIDDISVQFGSCSSNLGSGAEILPSDQVCSLNCSFDRNVCSWNQMITDAFDWTRQSGSTPTLMTGPSSDHTGDGHYLYIEANSASLGDTARLISSECSASGPQCLQFWYHMYGSADTMGLHLYLLQDKKADAIWRKRNDQGNMWHLAQVDLTITGAFQIIVEGRRGSNKESDVAIDDVTLYHGHCSVNVTDRFPVTTWPPVANVTGHPVTENDDTGNAENRPQSVCQVNCNFENDLCQWNQLVADVFDWTRQSGSTPTLMTGPSSDHTTGHGHYLYIEANSASLGDTARLISSECSASGPQCLQFWYHMYGSADTMGLHLYLLQDQKAEAIWRKRNDQGNMWHLAQVDLTVKGDFQIIIEGRRGSNEESDVAIDDVTLHNVQCSELSGVVTTPPPKPEGNATAVPELPAANVTDRPPVANATVPPVAVATTNIIINNNLTEDAHRPSHSVCQLNCNFENDLCQWKQLVADAFDWTRHNGSTPTFGTGPSSDHTTEDGHYLYIEANSASLGDTARLISSECSASGPQCLQFWYHMYGSADTMGLHLYLLQDKKADAIWRKRNDQGNMWHLAQVDLTVKGDFQIIIEGRRGSNEESDVAIDDVTLHNGQCSELSGVVTTPPPKPEGNATAVPELPAANVTDRPPVANATVPPVAVATTDIIINNNLTEDAHRPSHSVCQLNCNFENDLCQWKQLVADAFDWTRHNGSTPTFGTGPSSDHTTEDGHYLYIEANSASLGDTARLISSECSASGPQCLQFWYHMYGSADTMGLHLYLLQDKKADAIWRKRNDQGNMWHLAQVDLTVKGDFQIIIEGRRGSNEESDVAIDDVTLHNGQCSELSGVVTTPPPKPEGNATAVPELPAANVTDRPPVANATVPPVAVATTNIIINNNLTEDAHRPSHSVCQLNCNFENDLCHWSQLVTDAFDWTRQSGSTPTFRTGPSSDHTTGHGHYLYIEANSASLGDTARLISSECPASGPQCLQFWYHMYGSAETMGLHVYLLQDKQANAISWIRNNQGNVWRLAQVDFTSSGPFQILYEGRRGSNDESDVAIDDISLYSGRCSDLIKPTPPVPMTTHSDTTEAGGTSSETQTTRPATTKPSNPNTSTEAPGATVTIQPPSTTEHTGDDVTEGPGPEPTTEETTTPVTYPHSTARPAPQTTERDGPTTGSHPKTSVRPETPTQSPPATAGPQSTTSPEPQPPSATTESHSTTTVKPEHPNETHPATTVRPQPPFTLHPTPPSCIPNSHYSPCVPACSPTCSFLNGPPDCNHNGACEPGCVCDDGYVLKLGVCVPVQQCGCVDRDGNKYTFGQVWYTKHCRQKCRCERDDGVGEIDCDEHECDENAVCLQNEEGHYYCQKTGFDECTINGEPGYKTFDSMKHDFEGEHSYVLVQTKNLPSNLQDVYIEGVNTPADDDDDDSSEEDDDSDDDSNEHEDHNRLQWLKIQVYNHTVEFKKHQKLFVDGQRTKTPVSPSLGVKIKTRSSHIYLNTDFGLSVKFDGRSDAEITLPRTYKRKVGGLCGNFDGRILNDRMKPDGTVAKTVQEFGESWRV
ncbi:MAM and LDL-receptor class A domain-containing protein 1 [Festucalex cinctus]